MVETRRSKWENENGQKFSKELSPDENRKELVLAENESGLTGDEYDKQRLKNTRKRESLISLTEGFYIGNWESEQLMPGARGIVELSKEDPVAIFAARLAIHFLNIFQAPGYEHLVNPDLPKAEIVDFMELMRVNREDKDYYLTVKASDNNFYEAKINLNLEGKSEVQFVRPAVHYPKVNREIPEI